MPLLQQQQFAQRQPLQLDMRLRGQRMLRRHRQQKRFEEEFLRGEARLLQFRGDDEVERAMAQPFGQRGGAALAEMQL